MTNRYLTEARLIYTAASNNFELAIAVAAGALPMTATAAEIELLWF